QSRNVRPHWHADTTLQFTAEPTTGAERVEIARYADKLNIGAPSTTANLKERACGKGTLKGTIMVDPAFGGKRTGKTVGDKQEKDITRAIARQLSSSKKFSFTTTRSVDVDEEKNMQARTEMTKDAAAIITLTIGDTIDPKLKENTVIAYVPYNSKESKDLACNLLNSLAQLPSITGTIMIPIDAQLTAKDDPKTRLEDEADPRALIQLDKPAVALAIGNPSQQFNTVQLGDAILAGLAAYSP
ncbi:N-acetylmuramoyl-L-alanine amidase, partial [Candidatus Woesearchaeota archaeon]|nr:N-acetylmuramoyl-L-alanine amidase [Candidatus Woesearchaeota archaeon]